MEPIQYIGMKDLEESEVEVLNRLAQEHHTKLQRELHNMTSLVIHIKTSHKEGKRKQYNIMARAVAPTRIFESSETDWDIARTLHMIFNDLRRQIQHSFHSDDQHGKTY